MKTQAADNVLRVCVLLTVSMGYIFDMSRSIFLLLICFSLSCVQSTSNPRSTNVDNTALTIVTANLRYSAAKDGPDGWGFRKEGLLARLRRYDADVIGVQEALADQNDALVAAFPEYQVVGVGREDGKRKGEFASLLIRSARFEVLESGTFWLSPEPEKVGSVGWDAALTRICTWARVRDRLSNRETLLANTHFDHVGVRAREESAKLIASRLPTLFPGRPMILTGDFNSDETTSAYRSVLSAGLKDAYREVHVNADANEATFHAFKGTTSGKRIDFVFCSKDFSATEATIDRAPLTPGRFPSDHFFVVAKVK